MNGGTIDAMGHCDDCGLPFTLAGRESGGRGDGGYTCTACGQEREAAATDAFIDRDWRLLEDELRITDETSPWRERAEWLLPRAYAALARVDHAVTHCWRCGSLAVTLECWVDAVTCELRDDTTAELDGDSAHCETCDELGSLAFGTPAALRVALEGPTRVREWEAYAQREHWSVEYRPEAA